MVLRMACTIDFRCLDEGFGGKTHKRKRSKQAEEELNRSIQSQNNNKDDASMEVEEEEEEEEEEGTQSKRQAVSSSDNPDKSVVFGKPTYDGVIAGKVSGRKWKQPRTHRASTVYVTRKSTTYEQRMKQKKIKRAYTERITELKEEIRHNKVEKRKKRQERDNRKQDNILRSGTKLQKITNPKTLKKIAKSKHKKLLKVVPDDLLNNNNNKKKD
ncbi:coiled-coil domain-containing protein 86-like [Camellia sinensis]|uniref:coiled-coil domain-containing protein 86-like n=1 Tax=Camellia sinensis TaxID=4442 RepID=UPI00103688A3|nr:coiled-coil domain-containing protein 86-like [Camellia sinensis]